MAFRIRYISGTIWFLLVLMLALLGMALALLIGGAMERNGQAPFVTGVIVTVFAAPLLVLVVPVFRAVVVTRVAIRIPNGFKTNVVATAEIAGVGLLYRRTPNSRAPEGWFLELWDGAGHRHQIGKVFRAGIVLPTPPGQKRALISLRVNRPPDWPLPSEDLGVLAASRPGKIATSVYEFVIEAQGPRGPLAARALQKHERADRWAVTKTLAWWSPDGEMGRVSNR